MGKVVSHPSVEERSPLMTVAEVLEMAQEDRIADICIVVTDYDGKISIAYSKQSPTDMLAAAALLHDKALRLLKGDR